MCPASLIHLVLLSDSLSEIVDASQLITWLSWLAWSVKADLFCSDKLDRLLNSCERFVCCCLRLCLVFFKSCAKLSPSLTYVSLVTILPQAILYTQSVISTFSGLSFECTSSLLKVLTDLTVTALDLSSSLGPPVPMCLSHKAAR